MERFSPLTKLYPANTYSFKISNRNAKKGVKHVPSQ